MEWRRIALRVCVALRLPDRREAREALDDAVRDKPSADERVFEHDRHPGPNVGRVEWLDDRERACGVTRRHAARLDDLELPAHQERRAEQDSERQQHGDGERSDGDGESPPLPRTESCVVAYAWALNLILQVARSL